MLALFAAPTVVAAQTPAQDQYVTPPESNPNDENGNEAHAVQVNVREATETSGKLPFTGGSVPLVVLIGLVLLAGGLVTAAATRKRRTSGSV